MFERKEATKIKLCVTMNNLDSPHSYAVIEYLFENPEVRLLIAHVVPCRYFCWTCMTLLVTEGLPSHWANKVAYESGHTRMRTHRQAEMECHDAIRLLAIAPGPPYHRMPENYFPATSHLLPQLDLCNSADLGVAPSHSRRALQVQRTEEATSRRRDMQV